MLEFLDFGCNNFGMPSLQFFPACCFVIKSTSMFISIAMKSTELLTTTAVKSYKYMCVTVCIRKHE